MITALVSAVTGLLSGTVPDIVREIKDSRAHNREVEFLRLNSELAVARAKAEADVKIEEAQSASIVAEVEAGEKQFQTLMAQSMQPIGIGWLDTFNAAIRPITAAVFMGLFALGVAAYSLGVLNNDAFGASMAVLYGEMMQGVIGWFFGFRSYKTLRSAGE